MKSIKYLVILGALVVMAAPAFAQSTAVATVNVSANVVKACVWDAATANLAFGQYDPFDPTGTKTATAMVRFRCTKNKASETITVTVASANTYQMVNSADSNEKLTYAVLNGAAPLAATETYTNTSSAWHTYNLNGTLGGGQDVADGNYADTITFTVNY